ncbi:LodA/GoxA family CTQ-dependent oxidase [Azospirillum sp. TSO35-2]|uniref:LodA/GoxA family CTQ-dependent oxidase n=1 Tax=Azospirillum sp. TSO35-2 TaxID=716796 RepID=UPI000D62190B|nr:LodA/GoxA family CTQ-dependent oxidase [Azospirillum sp. TSO35-2]PWC39417.1 hypothetical protein TSO352_04480 [Azospirillum sp. TSO35-2]
MSSSIFRVHPAVGIARVGNSPEYYLAPETAAGEPVGSDGLMGGLPIKAGTEDTGITDADFRDADQKVKRQAARFRIYQYPADSAAAYPNGQGTEVTLNSMVDGKRVVDIVWTVHLANKKLNNYAINDFGLDGYTPPALPAIRNQNYSNTPNDLNDPTRRTELVIDPGPRAVSAARMAGAPVAFDAATPATCADANGEIVPVPAYPKSFPADHHALYEPLGPLDSLGDVVVEPETGRLIVAGGFGKTAGVLTDGNPPPLNEATENGLWFDDTSDGPVDAVLVLRDEATGAYSRLAVHGAWVVTGDPGYAPQTRNVVSAWDDVFDVWVRSLNLLPALYDGGGFNTGYRPSFSDDVLPIFHAAMLQRWNTNLPQGAIKAHTMIGSIKPTDDPTMKIPDLTRLIRNPNGSAEEIQTGSPLMPLSLGDMQKSFLTVSQTQYFFLTQWHAKAYQPGPGPALGPGERLDYVSLANCLGGRYSPGIEVSFPVRDTHLYATDWRTSGCGPFRINAKPLDYATAVADRPFLTAGYTPQRDAMVEPGDVSKFMSVPWHTDYNSCAVHLPDPNPNLPTGGTNPDGTPTSYPNNTLFWSWPAERPVQVHPARLCRYDADAGTWTLGGQTFSVRGDGTATDYPANAGRYQSYSDYVKNWHRVGFVIQGTQIASGDKPSYGPDLFLEVQSLFTEDGPLVQPWPTANVPAAPVAPAT